MGTRIPFGYRIVEGKAQSDPENEEKLKLFFRLYLEGLTMAGAARTAGLPVSASTLPHLFQRKEYLGTDYYPPIVSPAYQEQLIREWKKRKQDSPRTGKKRPKKAVRIHICFHLEGMDDFGTQIGDCHDPAGYAEELYQRIHPQYLQE